MHVLYTYHSAAGALGAFVDADWFIASQISSTTTTTTTTMTMTAVKNATAAAADNDNARLVALQLGNTYALLCLLGVAVLWTTAELRVVRAYLAAAWLADASHIGLTCWLLGRARALDVAAWNAMTWGNVGFTVSFSPSPHPPWLSDWLAGQPGRVFSI